MLILKIAFRNIFRQKRRSVLTALTMAGGFTLAAISIGWSDGSYNFIIDMFTRNRLGHIQIHQKGYRDRPSIYKTIADYRSVGETISAVKGVEGWTPRLYSAALASIGEKTSGVQIVGIDPLHENQCTKFNKKIVQGNPFQVNPEHAVIMGKGLARILRAKIGDQVVIVTQGADGSIANDLYNLVGIIETGSKMLDRTVLYMHLRDAQELLVLPDQVHEIAVIVEHLKKVPRVARQIEKVLNNPELEVAPWQVFARSFYQAMKADQEGMWIMLFVILLVVAVGVLNTVLMSVLERQREYGLLKAIGTKPTQIVFLVLHEVNFLALGSILIGAILGTTVNYLLSHQGVTLPQAFTYGGVEFKTMYTEVNARSLYLPAITILLSSWLVSLFPAIKAARTEPAKAMRIH